MYFYTKELGLKAFITFLCKNTILFFLKKAAHQLICFTLKEGLWIGCCFNLFAVETVVLPCSHKNRKTGWGGNEGRLCWLKPGPLGWQGEGHYVRRLRLLWWKYSVLRKYQRQVLVTEEPSLVFLFLPPKASRSWPNGSAHTVLYIDSHS